MDATSHLPLPLHPRWQVVAAATTQRLSLVSSRTYPELRSFHCPLAQPHLLRRWYFLTPRCTCYHLCRYLPFQTTASHLSTWRVTRELSFFARLPHLLSWAPATSAKTAARLLPLTHLRLLRLLEVCTERLLPQALFSHSSHRHPSRLTLLTLILPCLLLHQPTTSYFLSPRVWLLVTRRLPLSRMYLSPFLLP